MLAARAEAVVEVARPEVAGAEKMAGTCTQAHKVAMQDARLGESALDRQAVPGVRNAWSGLAVRFRFRQQNLVLGSEVQAETRRVALLHPEMSPRFRTRVFAWCGLQPDHSSELSQHRYDYSARMHPQPVASVQPVSPRLIAFPAWAVPLLEVPEQHAQQVPDEAYPACGPVASADDSSAAGDRC